MLMAHSITFVGGKNKQPKTVGIPKLYTDTTGASTIFML